VLPYTVWQIVEMGRLSRSSKISGMTSYDLHRIEEALDFVRMKRYSARYFSSLSGGEKQRVLIAMALAQDPEILLLDEPTASLDIGLKSHLMNLLRKLNQEKGITVATISHDIQLAASFCDKLVMIKNGRIVSQGSVKEVLNSDTISSVYSCNAEVIEYGNKLFIETK
jgi:iron complex transport system ATP-binding protein